MSQTAQQTPKMNFKSQIWLATFRNKLCDGYFGLQPPLFSITFPSSIFFLALCISLFICCSTALHPLLQLWGYYLFEFFVRFYFLWHEFYVKIVWPYRFIELNHIYRLLWLFIYPPSEVVQWFIFILQPLMLGEFFLLPAKSIRLRILDKVRFLLSFNKFLQALWNYEWF